MLKQEELGV